MAQIRRNFTAKDIDGNVKHLDLDSILSGYATIDSIDEAVQNAMPEALVAASLSMEPFRAEASLLDAPFSTSTVKLSTMAYGVSSPIYETEYEIEDRTLSISTDAYRFHIEDQNAPFGVASNKKCFLVLSFGGMDSFSSRQVYGEAECRESGACGGNPIILDWNETVLGEGGSWSFSYRDESLPEGYGVRGRLTLSNRLSYSGSIHWYRFSLDAEIYAYDAWRTLQSSTSLLFRTRSANGTETEDKISLSSVAFPKLASISLERSGESISGVETVKQNLSQDNASALVIRAHRGIAASLETDDPLDAASDTKVLSLGLDFSSSIGSGIVLDSAGRLSVPVFSQGTSGLVPSPDSEDPYTVLTEDGWKALDDLGVPRNIQTFIGATETENGWQGLVPSPSKDDRFKFLRGDGTWIEAVDSIDGSFECHWRHGKKEVDFAIGIFAGGEWLDHPIAVSASLYPEGTEYRTYPLSNVDPSDISGFYLAHPYYNGIPRQLEDRQNGWIADKTFWQEDKSRAYAYQFADGTAVETWLSVETAVVEVPADEENPDSQPEEQTFQYAVLNVSVHGPLALKPFLGTVLAAGTEAEIRGSAEPEGDISAVAAEGASVCSLPTPNSMLYDPDESGDLDFVPQAEWMRLEPNSIYVPELHSSVRLVGSEVKVRTDSADADGWPNEASGAVLTLDYGHGSLELEMGCLTDWLNSKLEEISFISSIPVFGQAIDENGTSISGLVPPASVEDGQKFLNGTGSWVEMRLPSFCGSTSTEAGTSGLVPAPDADDTDKFLKGDGTWAYPVESISAVTGVDPLYSSDGRMEPAETANFSAALDEANALLAADPSAKIWISSDGTVSTSQPPEGEWISVQFQNGEVSFGQCTDGMETLAGIETAAPGGNEWTVELGSEPPQNLAVSANASDGVLRLESVRIITETFVQNVSGIRLHKQNILTGEQSEAEVNLEFKGASEVSGGRSGLVPRPAQGDYGKYLSADGTWKTVDASSIICSGYDASSSYPSSDPLSISASDSLLDAIEKLDSRSGEYVTLTGDQTVDGIKTMLKNQFGVPVELEDGTIDVSESAFFTKTIDADTELSFTGVAEGKSASFTLVLENGGSHEIQWPANIQWPNGTPPDLKESGTDLLQFVTWDGGQTWTYVSSSGSVYEGATAEKSGTAGLVPAASSSERNCFLRGDGTWADASISGSCTCGYAYVKKQWALGVSICDGDGSWLSTAVKVNPSIRPEQVLTYTLNLRFGADGPGGCALWNPYNATPPISAETRTYEFYRDSTVWLRGTSNHYIQTFSDGLTMDCWIEVDETQAGYHNLRIAVYGPKAAAVPRLVSLNVDGTDVTLVQNLASGESFDIPVSGTEIKIYPRPTKRTVLWRNEFSEWSGTGLEPVLLTETPAEFPYLSYTAQRTETGVRITADGYSLADWPIELSSTVLHLSAGGEQTDIDLGCLPAWVSNELLKVDEALDAVNAKVDAIGLYQGATENENGVAGLVPPALSAERNSVFNGDGTWHGSSVVVTDAEPVQSDKGSVFLYIQDF